MSAVLADLSSAFTSIRAARATAAAAVLILALGTGANVSVLAVAYGALARPVPIADVDRLVVISIGLAHEPAPSGTVRLEDLERWRASLRTLSGVAGWTSGEFTLKGLGPATAVRAAIVTDNFFEVLGAAPAAGRVFRGPSDSGLAVLSDGLARRAGGQDALSRAISIGSLSLSAAAILPPTFPLPDRADLWVPAQSVDALNIGRSSNMRAFRMVGRLAPGVTLEQAQDDATRVNRALEAERNRSGETRAAVTPLGDLLVGETRPVLVAFIAAAVLVLFVACANVATLLLSRALGRQREYAVRMALGASPGRLVRTALFESLIVAVAAGAVGAGLAWWGLAALPAIVEGAVPRSAMAALGWPALVSCAIVAAIATVLSGVAPALAASRSNFAPAFRTTTIAGTAGGRRLRGALVIVQIAVAVTLLVGAGLLARTVTHLLAADLGVNGARTLMLRLRMTEHSRFDAGARAPFVSELVRRVRALPGVEAAGVGTNLPPNAAPVAFSIRVVDGSRTDLRTFDLGSATSGYFEAIGARLVRGRWFEARDDTGPAVVVLTETAARHMSPLADPVGGPLPIGLPGLAGQPVKPIVIGVIEDIRHHGLERPARGGIYLPWSLLPAGYSYLAVQSARSPETITRAVLGAVRELDPALPLPEVRTIDQERHRAILGREMRVVLVGTFALLAAVLAMTGLSGVLGRSVVERRRELAIRMALGGTPGGTVRLVVRDGLVLQAIGLVVGLGLALALARTAAGLLYGVSPYDGVTFAAVAGATCLLGLAAVWVPARRAARVSPQELLRSET